MTILALDTASAQPSIAIVREGHTLFEGDLPSGRGQSAHLLTNVKEALKTSELDYSDLTALIVLTGPGSFTGTRVGIAFAKGLSMALKIPLYGVHHFALLAEGLKTQSAPVLIALESGRDEKFFQICHAGQLQGQPINCTWKEVPSDICSQASAYTADFAVKTDIEALDIQGSTARRLAENIEAFHTCSEKVTAYYIRPADTTVKSSISS